MAKFLIPHTIKPHSVDVSVDPEDSDIWQIALLEGEQDVHYVLLTRDGMKRLAEQIERKLKMTPAQN